jgi:hypothetical protein
MTGNKAIHTQKGRAIASFLMKLDGKSGKSGESAGISLVKVEY